MRSIEVTQRRARLAVRHRLAPSSRTDDITDIVRSLVVLHATDPATVFLSVGARSHTVVPAHVEQALYDDRTLVRLLAMRRTMFIAPVELLPALQTSCSEPLAAKQRRTYARFIEQAGVVDGDVRSWLAEVEEETHQALLARGAATGAQLSKEVPRLRTQIDPSPGKTYSRPPSITTWVLVILGLEGRIVRGRPNGSWASSQYLWSPMESWLPDGISHLSVDEARAELVRQWLYAFGPAPVADIKWWTGWNLGDVRKASARLDLIEVDLDGTTGVMLADDQEPIPDSEPWAALLPALDPTPMGWQSRDWYLGPHGPALFDRNGNVGPTIWWNGRIVGGWGQRKDGEIAYRLLEDIGTDAKAMIESEVARMSTWYGDIRAIPRFRTPLEKELTA